MFNIFSKDGKKTVRIRLSDAGIKDLTKLRGLFTYKTGEEVSASSAVETALSIVCRQKEKKEHDLLSGKNIAAGTFIMLVGIPCSGKTVYASNIVFSEPDTVVINATDMSAKLFSEYGVHFSEQLSMDLIHCNVIKALEQGKKVIYDACNLDLYQRKTFLKLLEPLYCTRKCVVLNRPAEDCENQNRLSKDPLPDHVMTMFEEKRVNYPSYSEGWDEVVVIETDRLGRKTEHVLPRDEIIPWNLGNDRRTYSDDINNSKKDDVEKENMFGMPLHFDDLDDTAELPILHLNSISKAGDHDDQ